MSTHYVSQGDRVLFRNAKGVVIPAGGPQSPAEKRANIATKRARRAAKLQAKFMAKCAEQADAAIPALNPHGLSCPMCSAVIAVGRFPC